MRIGIHQPNFLPWLGFFWKMTQSDAFVYLDDVQFSKNSFTNRNKIKTPQGPLWLTVPVSLKNHIEQTLREIKIDNASSWKKKHLGTLQANYGRSKNFKLVMEILKEIYEKEWIFLIDLNTALLEKIRYLLGIDTPIFFSSKLDVDSRGTQRLVDIVKYLKGDTYLSGSGGNNYQDAELFRSENITLEQSDFRHPTYDQMWDGFEPNLSIIDYLFNTDFQASGKNLGAAVG